MRKRGTNPNHPKRGTQTKVEPIRDIKDINRIKQLLAHQPRNLCLFVLGINTAYRANELLSITCGQVRYSQAGDVLRVMQDKTGKYRSVTLNRPAVMAIQDWLRVHPNPTGSAALFVSRKGGSLTVPAVSKMVKNWCRAIGMQGNYASHSLRKTWGFQALRGSTKTSKQMVLPILMMAYGHARERQTLAYLSVQHEEVAELYLRLEL